MNGEPASRAAQSGTTASRCSSWGRVWRVFTDHHFSPYKVYINRLQRTVVVLNPKVGTQSFRFALNRGLLEFGGLADVSAGRYRGFNKAREFPFARLRDYVHAFRFAEEYSFLGFVRNPYRRLRSAWLDKLAFGHRDGYPRSTRRRVLGPLRRFAREHHLAGGESGAAIPFSTFVAYVESEPIGRRDHHWDEQYSVLLMKHVRFAHVFQLETQFREGLTRIFTQLGFAPGQVAQLVATQRNASPSVAEPVFDEALAVRARRIYARDFETFGYDPDSWRGL